MYTGLQSRPTTDGSTETPTTDAHVCANGPIFHLCPGPVQPPQSPTLRLLTTRPQAPQGRHVLGLPKGRSGRWPAGTAGASNPRTSLLRNSTCLSREHLHPICTMSKKNHLSALEGSALSPNAAMKPLHGSPARLVCSVEKYSSQSVEQHLTTTGSLGLGPAIVASFLLLQQPPRPWKAG
jgi:hypothetical protein